MDYLDSLRAVAVLVVFIMHVTEVYIRITPKQPGIFRWAYEMNLGRVGVVTFFAISGFLIPSSLRGTTGLGLLRFLITRVCRLYPAFIVSLLPSAATYELMTQGLHFTLHQFLLNLTMVPRLFDETMLNGAYWTLEVELTFYLLCCFLFCGGVLRNGFVLAALMAGLFFLFYSSQGEIWGGLLNIQLGGETFFLCLNLACMFWGAVIRRWWDGDVLNGLTKVLTLIFSVFWLVYMPVALFLDRLGIISKSLDSRLIAGYSIGLGLFIVGIFIVRVRSKVVGWFGRISYSFYLTHQAGFYIPYWLALHYPRLQNRAMVYYLVASFITSTALASASYYLIERPFIRLGRRLTRGLSAPSLIIQARSPLA